MSFAHCYHREEPYTRQYWCWIGNEFTTLRIVGEYAWLGLTLFFSIALYIPLFLLHWGVIRPGTSWYSPKAGAVFMDLQEPYGDHGSSTECERGDYTVNRLSGTPQVVSREDRRLWFIIL
jgi:hypothetical protein